jgi:hypothetical protein
MADSWTEIWSVGSGRSRMYCGVAETDGEYAVDIFSGDTCVSSDVFGTRSAAMLAAHSSQRRFLAAAMAPAPAERQEVESVYVVPVG